MQSVETVVAVGAPSGLFFPPVTVLVCINECHLVRVSTQERDT